MMTDLIHGPWFWLAEDPECPTEPEDAVDSAGYGQVIEMWEGGVTRVFFVVQMPVPNSDDSETKEFPTEGEANEWVRLRQAEIDAAEAVEIPA